MLGGGVKNENNQGNIGNNMIGMVQNTGFNTIR